MSILNAFVTPDLALIGVDTEARLPDGATYQVCKLVTVPHLGAAAGFRGLDVLQMFAASAIISFKGDFDALAETMPGLLTEAERFCRDQFGASGDALAFNVVLVGYSESAGCMVGHAFDRTADSEEIKIASGLPNFIAPDVEADQLRSLHIVADKPGMSILARHQCQLIRDHDPGMAAGGRFFIAEVRRNSIHVEQAFEFPPRPEKVG
ncbi:hypothetical protein [Ectopseudomonas khazarica]|uniref:hypothetical protein n=1 Tax=Ectopseudomonas khazarica TaxID=2502979 RepID=UPI003B934C63